MIDRIASTPGLLDALAVARERLLLIVAFSVGLASAKTALGLLVINARRLTSRINAPRPRDRAAGSLRAGDRGARLPAAVQAAPGLL